jgi:outer membrane protein assembly factor BamB
MSKRRLLLAATLGLLLLLPACREKRDTERQVMAPKPFKQWTKDFGALAIPQSSVDGTNNWYFPATLSNLDMRKALWVRDVSPLGDKRFVTGGGRVFYFGTRGYIGALDAATGQTIWEVTPKPGIGAESYNPSSITLTQYSVVILARRGTTHRQLDFYDAQGGELMRTELLAFDPVQIAALDGKVFAIGEDGQIEGFAEESGEHMISARQVTTLLDIVASPGRLTLLGREGAAFSLDTQELKPDAVRLFSDRMLSPFLMDGKLVLFGETAPEVLVLDPLTLTTKFRGAMDTIVNLLPTGAGNRIYFGQGDGRFRCYNIGTGKYIWTRDLEASCYVFAAFANCIIAVADYPSVSGTINQQQGQDQRESKPLGEPSWFPEGSAQGYCLFVLSTVDGSVIGKFPGNGYMMPQSVIPQGILVREDPAGTLSCYPADIKPFSVLAGGGEK